MEDEPVTYIKMYGERVEMNRRNSSIWQFAGKLAIYNHIFIIDDAKKNYGYYFADLAKATTYAKYVRFMTDNDFSLHLNLYEVCDKDVEVYNQYHPAPPPPDVEIPKMWEGLIGHE